MTENTIGMRVRQWAQGAGTRWAVAAILLLAAGSATQALAAAPMQLTYRVTHSLYGDIGTYVNTIEPNADGTTVQTRAHFQVKMLGVNMYSEDAQRTEQWQGNRLVSFNGVTSKGSQSTVVRGEARGNSFVINSPQGTVTAPASVHPANPWSPNFLSSNTMMRPDSGRLERVSVSGGAETVVTIDGRPVRARKYEVDGATRYGVWLDNRGVPVMFVVDDNSGKVTFTLASCTSCDVPAAQQLGMK
ncbi:MAG TPA: DUF6134 family protein [Stellaceae bacterium]|jgi:hypothetical protein|nr:DUF6134 family protein [Stellaceae bacterium]